MGTTDRSRDQAEIYINTISAISAHFAHLHMLLPMCSLHLHIAVLHAAACNACFCSHSCFVHRVITPWNV